MNSPGQNAEPQADGHPGDDAPESATAGIPRTAEEAKLAAEEAKLAAGTAITTQSIEEEAVASQRAQLHERIENDFVFHAPTPDQMERYITIRERAKSMAHYLVNAVPPGRELSTALTKLEECVMTANAGIARHG